MGLTDTLKTVYKGVQTIGNMELLAEIQEAREEAVSLVEENAGLRQRIKDLEEALEAHGALEFDGAVYWICEGDERDGPVCPRCYDAERKLIRLHSGGMYEWECKACDNHYGSFGGVSIPPLRL